MSRIGFQGRSSTTLSPTRMEQNERIPINRSMSTQRSLDCVPTPALCHDAINVPIRHRGTFQVPGQSFFNDNENRNNFPNAHFHPDRKDFDSYSEHAHSQSEFVKVPAKQLLEMKEQVTALIQKIEHLEEINSTIPDLKEKNLSLKMEKTQLLEKLNECQMNNNEYASKIVQLNQRIESLKLVGVIKEGSTKTASDPFMLEYAQIKVKLELLTRENETLKFENKQLFYQLSQQRHHTIPKLNNRIDELDKYIKQLESALDAAEAEDDGPDEEEITEEVTTVSKSGGQSNAMVESKKASADTSAKQTRKEEAKHEAEAKKSASSVEYTFQEGVNIKEVIAEEVLHSRSNFIIQKEEGDMLKDRADSEVAILMTDYLRLKLLEDEILQRRENMRGKITQTSPFSDDEEDSELEWKKSGRSSKKKILRDQTVNTDKIKFHTIGSLARPAVEEFGTQCEDELNENAPHSPMSSIGTNPITPNPNAMATNHLLNTMQTPFAMPPNAMPPNAMQPYAMPPNAMQPYAMPPYSMPPYGMQPYAMPLLNNGFFPSDRPESKNVGVEFRPSQKDAFNATTAVVNTDTSTETENFEDISDVFENILSGQTNTSNTQNNKETTVVNTTDSTSVHIIEFRGIIQKLFYYSRYERKEFVNAIIRLLAKDVKSIGSQVIPNMVCVETYVDPNFFTPMIDIGCSDDVVNVRVLPDVSVFSVGFVFKTEMRNQPTMTQRAMLQDVGVNTFPVVTVSRTTSTFCPDVYRLENVPNYTISAVQEDAEESNLNLQSTNKTSTATVETVQLTEPIPVTHAISKTYCDQAVQALDEEDLVLSKIKEYLLRDGILQFHSHKNQPNSSTAEESLKVELEQDLEILETVENSGLKTKDSKSVETLTEEELLLTEESSSSQIKHVSIQASLSNSLSSFTPPAISLTVSDNFIQETESSSAQMNLLLGDENQTNAHSIQEVDPEFSEIHKVETSQEIRNVSQDIKRSNNDLLDEEDAEDPYTYETWEMVYQVKEGRVVNAFETFHTKREEVKKRKKVDRENGTSSPLNSSELNREHGSKLLSSPDLPSCPDHEHIHKEEHEEVIHSITERSHSYFDHNHDPDHNHDHSHLAPASFIEFETLLRSLNPQLSSETIHHHSSHKSHKKEFHVSPKAGTLLHLDHDKQTLTSLEKTNFLSEHFNMGKGDGARDELSASFQLKKSDLQNSERSSFSSIKEMWFKSMTEKEDVALKEITSLVEHLSQTYDQEILEGVLNSQDDKGNTLLHLAVGSSYWKVVDLLLQLPSLDVSIKNKTGYMPFMLAPISKINIQSDFKTLSNFIGKAKSLLDTPAGNAKHSYCLTLAAEHGNETLVQLLLSHGCNINIRDAAGFTPIMRATMNGHSGVVKLLLKMPHIDTDVVNQDGRTAWDIAMSCGHQDLALLIFTRANFIKASSKTDLLPSSQVPST